MDCVYDLAKYHGIQITESTPTIQLWHNHQRLVKESRKEDAMDPYPKKYVAHLDVLVNTVNNLAKIMAKR